MKPLVFYDLETTDCDLVAARIVQVAFVAEDGEVLFDSLINPGCPIPPASSEIHGVTDERVADAPRFEDVADRVQTLVADVVLAGYNSRRFDAPILDAALRRAGRPGLDLHAVQEVDVFRVWLETEPRTLAGAVRQFLGRDHEDAHEALGDAKATQLVLEALSAKHSLSREDLLRLSRPAWEVDRDGRFRRDEDTGAVLFAFGKYRGEPALQHAGYLKWMLNKDFSQGTKAAIRELLDGVG